MKIEVLSDRTFSLTPAMLMQIDAAAPGCELEYHPAASATDLSGAEVVFGCPPAELLREAVNLKWHHLPNAAIQPYTHPALYANPGITLTNSSGVYGAAIAEHVTAMVFSLARNFPLYDRRRRENIWKRDDESTVWVSGSTAAVFGMGDLGRNVSAKLKAAGMKVIGIRRSLFEKPPCVDELYDLRSFDDVLRRADFVICCLPLTNATRGLFDEHAFSAMDSRAFFINVGRGASVDTDALVSALKNGIIAGAALDVTDPEPLPKGHDLWGMDNVIITPHSSCVCDDVQERKLNLFLELLERYKNGRVLKNVVNFMQGY